MAQQARELDRNRLGDHWSRLYVTARALCDSHEDAEDLVQETCVRILTRPRLVREDDEARYLLRALRNTFLNGRRAASRRPAIAPMPEDSLNLDGGSDPLEILMAKEVYGAIASIPMQMRDLLIAVDVAGLSYREAARAFGFHPRSVPSRLFRARLRVAEKLAGM